MSGRGAEGVRKMGEGAKCQAVVSGGAPRKLICSSVRKKGALPIVDASEIVGRADHVVVEVEGHKLLLLSSERVDIVRGAEQSQLLSCPPSKHNLQKGKVRRVNGEMRLIQVHAWRFEVWIWVWGKIKTISTWFLMERRMVATSSASASKAELPLPLSLMPGPAGTESRCAPTIICRLVLPFCGGVSFPAKNSRKVQGE